MLGLKRKCLGLGRVGVILGLKRNCLELGGKCRVKVGRWRV